MSDSRWEIKGLWRGPYPGWKGPQCPDFDPNEVGIDEDGGRIGSCKVRFNVERPEWPKHWFKEEK